MGKRSPEKGAMFERACCQRLSLWVSDLEREDLFWRAAMSGGRANLKSRRARRVKYNTQLGDISAIHPLGDLLLRLFVVECKWIFDVNFSTVVFGRKGQLHEFWRQVMKECKKSQRHPMLIIRQNRKPEVLLTTKEGLAILNGASKTRLVVTAIFPRYGARVVFLRDVLTDVSFRRIRRQHTATNAR